MSTLVCMPVYAYGHALMRLPLCVEHTFNTGAPLPDINALYPEINSSLYPRTQTLMTTNIHLHTYMYGCICTYTHIHARFPSAHTHDHLYIRLNINRCSTSMSAQFAQVFVCAHLHTCILTSSTVCIHPCMRIRAHEGSYA